MEPEEPMPLSPRLSTPADVKALHRVWRSSVDATHGFVTPEDLCFYESLLVDQYLPQVPVWVLADDDGTILGFMGLTGPKIDALFVDAACHRSGVGRRLIDHALTLAPQLLVDVNTQNPGAIAFYTAMGFQPVGETPLDHAGKPYPLTFMARL